MLHLIDIYLYFAHMLSEGSSSQVFLEGFARTSRCKKEEGIALLERAARLEIRGLVVEAIVLLDPKACMLSGV